MSDARRRTRILYLAPWVDYGGSDKGTIDWFRWLDRQRFELFLATTQPSANRRLAEVQPYATEVWPLPDLMAGQHMPTAILDLLATREIDVLHIMNARLGFQLLPDLASLDRPPKVVVQLHVEEQDRSGYVRLVTRRYGNLVDAFSVTSQHLAEAVEGYDVPRHKIHVIHTGVDAETEFSPDRVRPVDGLDEAEFNILYPGRLVEQKDPLLMAEVAGRLVRRVPRARIQVVGEGPLEPDLREALRRHGAERAVRFSPPTTELASWFAACDALLMTSVFEGVPYVVYEALSMGVPVVAPALPGNSELLGDEHPGLVDPRDDADAYVEALVRLADDPSEHRAQADRGRALAGGELSLRTMAEQHEQLYADLLAGAVRPAPRRPLPLPPVVPLGDRPRRVGDLVSVIVPCFNHGRFLPEALRSIREQDYDDVEIIVVDDASTDPDTVALIEALEREADDVTVIRQPENGGPSRARNDALARARGRFVLPLDADNMLLPGAVTALVEQLVEAPAHVVFVYPNPQYFGTRRDLFLAPAFNPHHLLDGNYADTCSLFDADVFRRGLTFADDIKVGHEDWELIVRIAGAGYEGEPARVPTLLYRKAGFTRSDVVEHARDSFSRVVYDRHPDLYGTDEDHGRLGAWAGPRATLKARWSPGLSIICLEPGAGHGEAGARLWNGFLRQSSADFELLPRLDVEMPSPSAGPAIRTIPAALAANAAEALHEALRVARARWRLILAGPVGPQLDDPAFVEKVLRITDARPDLNAIAFVDQGPAGRYPLRPIGDDEQLVGPVHAVLVRADPDGIRMPAVSVADEDEPVDALVQGLHDLPGLQWRHLPSHRRRPPRPAGRHRHVELGGPRPRTEAERKERGQRFATLPVVPAIHADAVRRWTGAVSWVHPEGAVLVRHRRHDRPEWTFTNSRIPPEGYVLEFDLGVVHMFQPPGTAELRRTDDGRFAALPDQDEGAPLLRDERSEDVLGYLEQAAFPLLIPLEEGRHPETGQWVLVAGARDALRDVVEERRTLGFIEAFPNEPLLPPFSGRRYGLLGLVRAIDVETRRHRYAIGRLPAGQTTLELGGLYSVPPADGAVRFMVGGPDGHEPSGRLILDPDRSRSAVRWAVAPLTWRRSGPLHPRLRASARRIVDITREERPTTPPLVEGDQPAYLATAPAANRVPVHRAVHPQTRDVLLTRWPSEATDMGYQDVQLLGYAAAVALVTGTLDHRHRDIPWASRFGRGARLL